MNHKIKSIFFAIVIHLLVYAISNDERGVIFIYLGFMWYFIELLSKKQKISEFIKRYLFDCLYLLAPLYLTFIHAESEVGLVRVPLMIGTMLFTVYWFYKKNKI